MIHDVRGEIYQTEIYAIGEGSMASCPLLPYKRYVFLIYRCLKCRMVIAERDRTVTVVYPGSLNC